jgi:hypothetical protein
MASINESTAEGSNRKLGGILLGIIVLLVLISIIGVITLN